MFHSNDNEVENIADFYENPEFRPVLISPAIYQNVRFKFKSDKNFRVEQSYRNYPNVL